MPTHETGVPVPHPHKRRKRNLHYGFDRLQIGDSLFLDEPARRLIDSRLYNAARKYAQRDPSFCFTAARYPDGVRVWRIEKPTEPETPEWMA